MSDIKTTLSLKDNVTPALRAIMRSIDATYKAMEKLNKVSNAGMSKELQTVQNSIIQANNALDKMQSSAGRSSSSMSGIAQKAAMIHPALGTAVDVMKKLHEGAQKVGQAVHQIGNYAQNSIRNLAAGLYVFEKMGTAISGVMQQVDSLISGAARAELFSDTINGPQFMQRAYQIAQDTRSGLEETMELANKVMLSGVFDTNNAERALHLTELINKTLIAGGEAQEANNRALLQFNQALASGVMQGDELRSLREQTPYLMKILAEGLGEVDEKFKGLGIGDLKALGAQGELTSSRIVAAFEAMADKINEQFRKMPKTWGQGITVIKNFLDYFLYRLSVMGGPLERLTKTFWDFINTFVLGERATQVLDLITVGLHTAASAFEWLYQKSVECFDWITQNSDVVATALLTLGLMALTAFAMIAASAALTYWPIILMGIIFSGVISDMFNDGMSLAEVLGAIGEGIGNIAAFIVGSLLPALLTGIQVMVFLGGVVVFVIDLMSAVVKALVALFQWVFKALVIATEYFTAKMGAGLARAMGNILRTLGEIVGMVLGWIEGLARAVDAVTAGSSFETHWGDAVAGARAEHMASYEAIAGEWDAKAAESEAKMNQLFSDYENMSDTVFKPVNDKLAELFEHANTTGAVMDQLGGLADYFKGLDTESWGEQGKKIGENIGNKIQDAINKKDSNKLTDTISDWVQNLLDKDPDKGGTGTGKGSGGKNNVGTVDKVKKVDGDVAIKDEDIKLLRDMAARDFLMSVRTATPVANINFGDIHETADVGQIMGVIENMVEEQLATSMVS